MSVDCYLDGGSDGHFIRADVAEDAGLKLVKLPTPRRYELGDCSVATVTHSCTATFRLGGENRDRQFVFEVLPTMPFPIVIGNKVVKPEMQLELEEARLLEDEESEPWQIRSVPLQEELTDECPASSGFEGIDKVVREYRDVFKEEVTEEPAKTFPLALEVVPGGIMRLRQKLRHSPRMIPQKFQEEVKRQLAQMLASGVIEKAPASDFASQLLIVRKVSGALRLCVDFRDVNGETVPAHWPLPRIKDLVERLAHKSYYGTIDLCSGYWQIPMAESSRRLTTFTTPFGNYRFKRIPFGLSQAPAHFQRVIAQQVLAGLTGVVCESYIDDIVIYGNTLEEFEENLRKVLDALRKFGIKAKGSKCIFGKQEIRYLGLIITAAGYAMDPQRKEFVSKFLRPENIKELRAFLGTMNFFRDFIPSFGTVSAPLWAFLQGRPARKDPIPWTEVSIQAFEELKGLAANSSVLVFPEEEGELILYTDASDVAVGGVLMQRSQDGEEKPVQFISKTLNSAQRNYSVTEREMLALVHCVKALDYFLAGRTFNVYTDHQPLLSTRQSESPRVERWKIALAQYTFALNYIKGEENDLADCMSRLCIIHAQDEEFQIAIESTETATQDDGAEADWERIIAERRKILQETHEGSLGHLGINAMSAVMLEAGLHWKGVTKDIAEWINNCPVCQRIKSAKARAGENFCFTAESQNQTWVSDSMILESGTLGQSNKNFILVTVDVFSRFTMLRALETLNGKECVSTLSSLIADFGRPERIHTDNGSQFVNQEVSSFLNGLEIKHSTSIPHHHEGNAIAERAIQTVRNTLGAIQKQEPAKPWPDLLPRVQIAMNNRPHGGIFGFRPFDVYYRKYEAWGAPMAAQIRSGEMFDQELKKRKLTAEQETEQKKKTKKGHMEVAINDAPGRRKVAVHTSTAPMTSSSAAPDQPETSESEGATRAKSDTGSGTAKGSGADDVETHSELLRGDNRSKAKPTQQAEVNSKSSGDNSSGANAAAPLAISASGGVEAEASRESIPLRIIAKAAGTRVGIAGGQERGSLPQPQLADAVKPVGQDPGEPIMPGQSSAKTSSRKKKGALSQSQEKEVAVGDKVFVKKHNRLKSNPQGDRFDGPYEVTKVASRAITLADLNGGRERLADISGIKMATRAETLKARLNLGPDNELSDDKIERFLSYRARSNYSYLVGDFWVTIQHKDSIQPIELPLGQGGLQKSRKFKAFAELNPRLLPFVLQEKKKA